MVRQRHRELDDVSRTPGQTSRLVTIATEILGARMANKAAGAVGGECATFLAFASDESASQEILGLGNESRKSGQLISR